MISENHRARTGKRFGGVHLFETVVPARLREALDWSEVIVKIIAEEKQPLRGDFRIGNVADHGVSYLSLRCIVASEIPEHQHVFQSVLGYLRRCRQPSVDQIEREDGAGTEGAAKEGSARKIH